MSLDRFRSVDIRIDKADHYFMSSQFAKGGDYNGRTLVEQITNRGLIESQAGVTVNLGWRHESVGNSGLDPFEVVDAAQGIFEISYPREMLNPGRVTAVIQIIDGEIITETKNFVVQVEKSPIDETTIVSSNSFTVLQEALIRINQWNNTIEGKITTWEADMAATKQLYIDTLNDVEATYPQELISLGSQLAQTATKAELSGVATPKAVTLVAEMTDVAKVYVYTGVEGGYVAGNWYYHNGAAWTSGGVYQSTGISDSAVTRKKLDRLYAYGTVGKNKFDKSNVTDGYYIDPSNGAVLSGAGNSVSDFIDFEPSTVYQYSNLFTGALYDATKTFIQGTANVAGWNDTPTPSNARFVRVTSQNANLSIAQLEKGYTITEYESFAQIAALKSNQLSDLSGTEGLVSYVNLIVKADGSGDFLTPKLANDSITDSSFNKRYRIIVHPGVYTDRDVYPKDWVFYEGTDREKCVLEGSLPDSATDGEISPSSTLNLIYNGGLKNLTVTCKNMRYAVHDDGGGTDKIRLVEDCTFIHYGNQAARDYRVANSLPAGEVWLSENAYGSGVNSGDIAHYKNCTFVGTVNAWGTHNNENYEKPAYIEHDNCEFILDPYDNAEFHNAIGLAVMGSTNKDKLVFKGCRANGTIRYFKIGTPTIEGLPSKAEFEISGYGNDIATEVQLAGERYVPIFKDECMNVTATEAILKGQACCFTSDKKHVRKMTPSDDRLLFAGIAIKDIAIDTNGEVKHGGYIEKEDVNLGSVTFGVKYVVGTDSYLTVGTDNVIGVCLGYNQIKLV